MFWQKCWAAFLISLLIPIGTVAQGQASAKEIAKIRKKISGKFKAGDRVRLDLRDGRRVQGVVTEIRQDDFVLASEGGVMTLTFAEVRKVGNVGRRLAVKKAYYVTAVALGIVAFAAIFTPD